jgi:hypothetical protein
MKLQLIFIKSNINRVRFFFTPQNLISCTNKTNYKSQFQINIILKKHIEKKTQYIGLLLLLLLFYIRTSSNQILHDKIKCIYYISESTVLGSMILPLVCLEIR